MPTFPLTIIYEPGIGGARVASIPGLGAVGKGVNNLDAKHNALNALQDRMEAECTITLGRLPRNTEVETMTFRLYDDATHRENTPCSDSQ